LGQLLVIAHRTVLVKFDHFKQRFSPRQPIPVHLETLGDYLLLKRIGADLSQPELAVKSSVTVRKIKAREHDQSLPTDGEWELLAKILNLEVATRPTS
jgi:ribosome-binding protein aMBF1 (putative translation factor)